MTTKIEWATDSWNPITGCTPISEGCAHCYAKRMATRLAGRYGYPTDDPFRVTFHPDKLADPLGWKKPRRVFVCSMGDLFHEDVTWEQQLAVFEAMDGPHTYLILTKRPDRMKHFFQQTEDWDPSEWPHVWLGVTVENDKHYDRIITLLQIPAAVRFVSIEPMLGPVRLADHGWIIDEHAGADAFETQDEFYHRLDHRLDWVILGGETGPGARPMHPDWARSVRDQCQEAGVPFFFKHWGEWYLGSDRNQKKGHTIQNRGFYRVGKKAAGRLLDGREWNEYPKV